MERKTYQVLERYMQSCMADSAHDQEHIYRVLYHALAIAETESNVDYDVLVAACLLHDIGRQEQFANPEVDHAERGAQKAYHFLRESGFSEEQTQHICDCIRTHRYRHDMPPTSIEAKILFDADKIDVSGALGIARTLVYIGRISEPLYSVGPDGMISDGTNDSAPSFFQEYRFKLERLYRQFYTKEGARIAGQRRQAAVDFYDSMLQEVRTAYCDGKRRLDNWLKG